MSWYPIGRPIGTTIYPGMQITAVALCRLFKQVPEMSWKIPKEVFRYFPAGTMQMLPGHGTLKVGPMTLNQVCCMVPAWYGALATLLIFLLTSEVSGSTGAGLVAAFVMSTIPAHMMRSYAGEFDNECVAVSTFVLTFWLWCRALRTTRSWPIAILGGFAYTYAVCTWGGYIFVINLVGLHAAVLVALGKFNRGVYLSYTLFYTIGTAGATFVPVVGWAPLRSLETIAPLAVFIVYQLLQLCDVLRQRFPWAADAWRFFFFRAAVFIAAGLVTAAIAYVLLQLNYFGPLTSRIRGLIIKHKKTGNPLVDSVAEHRPASADAYKHYLHHARYVAVAGLGLCWHQNQPSKFFPVLYAAVAFHFSLKMSRLMIICGPIVSMLAGYPVGILADWCIEQAIGLACGAAPSKKDTMELPARSGGIGSIVRTVWPRLRGVMFPAEVRDILEKKDTFKKRYPWLDGLFRIALAIGSLYLLRKHGQVPLDEFTAHCESNAISMQNPKIVFQITRQDGKPEIISDYLDGYKWLKDNTPADSRVMAWWDYGYQITGVANRTSIADGNTWNHEHIATLGRTLTNKEKKAHNIMKHLADYVLVWAGGRSDDMGKSPHLARIANSIYPDTCGADDPTCRKFGITRDGTPTPMMAESFLYRAVNHRKTKGVALDQKLFKEVHTTKYGLMRIFEVLDVNQTSKAWVADPKNRLCDAPGSWYCVGQYPEALGKLIARRRNFAQLEDFNKKNQEKSEYTKMIERQQRQGKDAEL
mmetsp:Transcript_121783/g.190232  ORF Transcript_121783/g.190232 Transcript_121783/m.190232 type:complete len:756 (+) Transcript_121783:1-2268(+)